MTETASTAAPSSSAQPAVSGGNGRTVNLVSNAPASKIEGLEDFLTVFNGGGATAELTQFRYVIQRKAKRSIGGKFGKGLSTEVTENIEINPNEDLYGLRRWLGAIRQDPAAIMLLNIFKIKEDSLASPLIFSDMLRTGRPLLVTGADGTMRAQLVATADLTFKQVPREIANDENLLNSFLERPARRKGFVQTLRNVMDFEFLPDEVREKVVAINTGADPSTLSQPEIVNLCMLADTFSRYRAVLEQFRNVMDNRAVQVPQLMSMFDLVTADIPVNHLIAAFSSLLDDDGVNTGEITAKNTLFAHLNRSARVDDGSRKQGKLDRLGRFHKIVANTVVKNRMRVDPFLWKRCHFLGGQAPEEKKLLEGMRPLLRIIAQAAKDGEEAITPQFRKQVGLLMFELLQKAAGKAGTPDRRVAAQMLTMMGEGSGEAIDAAQYRGEDGKPIADPGAYLTKFLELPLTAEGLRQAAAKLRPLLFQNEMVAAEIQRSTLDVVNLAEQRRQKALRDIYVLSAVSELPNFAFHIGDKLNNLDRVCGISVAGNRMGLEISPQPTTAMSIGLFAGEEGPPLGTLQNDPNVLRVAYTELLGLRVEKLAKRAVDHKINYLQTTYGQNFFEVVYDEVVGRSNLPISRNQFAQFVKARRIMGNLDAKGWRPSNGNANHDPMLLFLERASDINNEPAEGGPLDHFADAYDAVSKEFKQLLAETKASAESDPREDNPNVVLWGLFKQGIYNLNRPEARAVFRKSIFFKYLQELIAKISSEHYSTFTGGLIDSGITIFIPWQFSYLQLIGNRFGFLMGDKVVKYKLLASPTDKSEELDEVSRVLYEQFQTIFAAEDKAPHVEAIHQMGNAMQNSMRLWNEFSRCLSIAILDRVMTETIIKRLEPGKLKVNNLWFLPDSKKLCLGRAVIATDTVPFAKILQEPENMGNVIKNPKSSSTTIDDFTIQVHSISRLEAELRTVAGVAEDALEILQNLSHTRTEGAAIQKYEQALTKIAQILDKPLRHLSEKDIQALHHLASVCKEVMQSFYNSPSAAKQKITTRLQSELQARRSDGHALKLTFSDAFIIDKTQIKVTQKVQQGGEVVKRQKKVEVEMDAQFQTLPIRMREVIRTQQILAEKAYVLFSPEGQKKKQVSYTMDIIDTLLALRGAALTFYVDAGGLSEDQMHYLAKRIKPYNFFYMDAMKPEAPEGVKTDVVMDPLTGRATTVIKGGQPTAASA